MSDIQELQCNWTVCLPLKYLIFMSDIQELQCNWTVCVPLKYLIFMSDIQEPKCFELTVKILPSL